jgi:chemotaxis protein histidine kinase CheA
VSSPPAASFLDFFVLEASEYIDKIDGLISRAADAAPDAEALQRAARALRGSATMARLQSFAELASSVESVGRSLRQGTLGWDTNLKGALTAAVDDFRILVRAARAWSPAEDESAMRRVSELALFAQAPAGAATPIAISGTAFFSSETSNIAAGLEMLATRPDDRSGGLNVLARVRALRGVAGVRDVPALAEVTEAAETGVRPLELGEVRLAEANVTLLRAAADLLRTISSGLSTGSSVTTSTPQYKAFLSALDGMAATRGADRVVPIADLFYNDAGPHVVSTATNPPTTPAQRFRMEVVSLGEHLHRVIDEARSATDAIAQEHARGELGRALRAIRATAASFGQMAVAQTVEAYLERTGDLNAAALDAISSFAATISPAAPMPQQAAAASVPLRMTYVREAVDALGTQRPLPNTGVTPIVPRPAKPPTPPAGFARVMPAVAPEAPPGTSPAPSIDSTIAAFESLSRERYAEPVAVDGNDIVPVESLLYRGRAAIERAIELRNSLRAASGMPDQEMLEELYDLVELARAE